MATANGTKRVWQGSNWIRKEKRLAIYMRDVWLCGYCGQDLQHHTGDDRRLRALDHITPVVLGGSNDATNLVTCCDSCNSRKAGLLVIDFCAKYGLDYAVVFARLTEVTRKPLNIKLAKDILAGKV